MKTKDTKWETVIHNMRFPLILGVIYAHVSLNGIDYATPIYGFIYKMVTVALIFRVPCFYFISGYLLFHNVENYSFYIYRDKLKRRLKTLLIPYLFWNAIILFAFWVFHFCFPGFISDDFNNVTEYGWEQLLRSFWNEPGGKPICFQFWFLRDLMVFVLLSPFVYVVSSYFSRYIVFVLFIIPFIANHSAIAYFAVGAFLSIRKIDVLQLLNRFKYIYVPICLLAIVLVMTCDALCLRPLCAWSGIFTFAFIMKKAVDWQLIIPKKVVRITFLVYAMHGLMAVFFSSFVSPIVIPYCNDLYCVLIYLLVPLLIAGGIYFIYYSVLNKYFPGFLAVITGGRR